MFQKRGLLGHTVTRARTPWEQKWKLQYHWWSKHSYHKVGTKKSYSPTWWCDGYTTSIKWEDRLHPKKGQRIRRSTGNFSFVNSPGNQGGKLTEHMLPRLGSGIWDLGSGSWTPALYAARKRRGSQPSDIRDSPRLTPFPGARGSYLGASEP